ncbi:hypothetical protein [Streptomyces sp. NPDC059894]|uniref:hypothetical protein n=1 Tax=unclassified Streptomyces TaxID=2593676 RepID=UPI00364D4BE6
MVVSCSVREAVVVREAPLSQSVRTAASSAGRSAGSIVPGPRHGGEERARGVGQLSLLGQGDDPVVGGRSDRERHAGRAQQRGAVLAGGERAGVGGVPLGPVGPYAAQPFGRNGRVGGVVRVEEQVAAARRQSLVAALAGEGLAPSASTLREG